MIEAQNYIELFNRADDDPGEDEMESEHPDPDQGDGDSDSSSIISEVVFGDLSIMGDLSAEVEYALDARDRHEQLIANLQDLLDLEEQGMEVGWPKGFSAIIARDTINRNLPPKLVAEVDERLPPAPLAPSSPLELPVASPVVGMDDAVQEAPSSSSSGVACSTGAGTVQAKPVRLPNIAPQRASIRQRFAFGNLSNETARVWTSRECK